MGFPWERILFIHYSYREIERSVIELAVENNNIKFDQSSIYYFIQALWSCISAEKRTSFT